MATHVFGHSLRVLNCGALRVVTLPAKHHVCFVQSRSASSFFTNSEKGTDLWRTVAGDPEKSLKNRARGKRPIIKKRKNLNTGQRLGDGFLKKSWPGLNSPVELNNWGTLPPDPKQEAKKAEILKRYDRTGRRQAPREALGWTSRLAGGRDVGFPDPLPGRSFEDFETRSLEVRRVATVKAHSSRLGTVRALVACGNRNGAVGFALGRARLPNDAIRKAKNHSIHFIHYVERFDNHTIPHDVEGKYHCTRIRMERKPRGYGLNCHRLLQELCYLIGIDDIYACIIGSTNSLNLTKAIFNAFSKLEGFQQIADREKLNVVEFRRECGPVPLLLASPTGGTHPGNISKEWTKELPLVWSEMRRQNEGRTVFQPFKRPLKLVNYGDAERMKKWEKRPPLAEQ